MNNFEMLDKERNIYAEDFISLQLYGSLDDFTIMKNIETFTNSSDKNKRRALVLNEEILKYRYPNMSLLEIIILIKLES